MGNPNSVGKWWNILVAIGGKCYSLPVEKSQPLGRYWENFLQLDEISLEYLQPLRSKEWHNQEEFVENFIELYSWGSGN
jgi:hypothetical protein